jgi:O-antigen/teichoic acid export membrane protein
MTSLAAFFWVRPFILSVGKARVLMGISVVAATLQLVLLLLLVPKLGPTGGATALSTGHVAFIGLELLYLHREGLLQAGKRQPVSDAPARIP